MEAVLIPGRTCIYAIIDYLKYGSPSRIKPYERIHTQKIGSSLDRMAAIIHAKQ